MKATIIYGELQFIPDCSITFIGIDKSAANILKDRQSEKKNEIKFTIMPEISDTKGARYGDEDVPGRSSPFKTYAHSENRIINIEMHFIALKKKDMDRNLEKLRLLQSALYPRDEFGKAPYAPPTICQIKCGLLLADDEVCAILKSYNIKFGTDVPYGVATSLKGKTGIMPYKFDVSTTWEVVYANDISGQGLPGQDRIIISGN